MNIICLKLKYVEKQKLKSYYLEENELVVYCNQCGVEPAEYICTNCKKVFCQKCTNSKEITFQFCNKCGSTNVQEVNTGNIHFMICLDCGSRNISIGNRISRLCPICKKEVRNINLLWKEINSTFRELVSKLTKFIQPLSEIIVELKNSKEKLVALRDQGFFIDIDVDRQLMDLNLMINKAIKEIETHLDILLGSDINIIDDKDFYFSNPNEFTNLINNVENMRRIVNNLIRYSKVIVEEANSRIPDIHEKIIRIQEFKNYITKIKDTLNITPNEMILGYFDFELRGSDFLDAKGQLKLVISDRQWILLKKNSKVVSLDPEQILSINIVGIVRKRCRIQTTLGFIDAKFNNANLRRFENLFNRIKYDSNLRESLVFQSVTTIAFEPELSNVKTKLSELVKKLRNPKVRKVSIDKLHNKPHEIPLIPDTTDYETELIRSSLTFRINEIMQELEKLKNDFQMGKIPYNYYIKRYTELYIEYFRLKNEFERLYER